MNRILLILLAFILSFQAHSKPIRFHFDTDSEGWGQWGDGVAYYDPVEGHQVGKHRKGSLHISNQFGQEHTWYQEFKNLKPGQYKVSAYIKGSRIKEGKWQQSFWVFYRSTGDIITPYSNIFGDFDWSKLVYTVDVGKNGKLELWFRLKTVGKVWIDEIKLSPYRGKEKKQSFTKSKKPPTLPKLNPVKKNFNKKNASKIILKNKINLPWTKYHNFTLSSLNTKEWKNYDFISMDIYNPSNEILPFVLVLADNQSNSYWNQLNHYTQLAPGKNKIRFSLKRFVGERGSVRVRRPIDLNQLSKFFVAIGPESTKKINVVATLSNMKLETFTPPPFFDGLVAMDFVDQPDNAFPGFIPITTQDFYHPILKLGFSDFTKFWRVHNSQYADSLHKDAILPLSGGFRVDLPNGKYKIRLVANHLGYWDVPFYNDRHIEIQGETVLHQNRRTASDYIKDYLQFEAMEPNREDNPYDLYLSKLFQPIEKEVEVTDDHLYIEFASDPSGIGLNSLLIWPVEKDQLAQKFIKKLNETLNNDFDNEIRKISGKIKFQKTPITLVDPGASLTFNNVTGKKIKKLYFSGGKGERATNVLKIGPFKNDKVISYLSKDTKLQVRRSVNQFVGHDLNHETYELAPRFLKPFNNKEDYFLNSGNILYIWLQYPIQKNWKAKSYKSTIQIVVDKKKYNYPISLKVRNYTLPKVPIPVGFFGLNPMTFSYYKANQIDRERLDWSKKSLKLLMDRGFTTWTGLPKGELSRSGDQLQLRTPLIDELFQYAKQIGFSGKVFSYGGEFLSPLLHGSISGRPSEWSYNDYLRKLNKPLTEKLRLWPPLIFSYSDEPTGYQNRLDADIKYGRMIKENIPALSLGGFVPMINSTSRINELYDLFNDGSYSNYNHIVVKKFKRSKKRWGIYNASPRSFNDPRYSYGEGLYKAYKLGLSHRLGWHFSGFNNYPYYDLDGRESDAVMVYPTSSGELLSTIKFELATLGLQQFRTLLLAEKLAKKGNKPLRKFLKTITKDLKALTPGFLSEGTYRDLSQLKNKLIPAAYKNY